MLSFDALLLFRLWNDKSLTRDEVARRLGLSETQLTAAARRFGLPPRGIRRRAYSMDELTPEVIAQRAAAIRATWSEEEREKRMVGRRMQRWQMPAYAFTPRTSSYREIAVD